MDRPSDRRPQLPKGTKLERRGSVRFPLALDVRYSVLHRTGPAETGSGKLVDVSSSGLRFTGEAAVTPGLKLDVAINWPVLLDGRIQLQLTVSGVAVRSSGTEISMRIQKHDFRTRSVQLKTARPKESNG